MDPPPRALTPGRARRPWLQVALDTVYGLAIYVATANSANSLLSRALTMPASDDLIDVDHMFAIAYILASYWSVVLFLGIMILDRPDRLDVRAGLAGLVTQLIYTDKLSHWSIHAVRGLQGRMAFVRWLKVLFEATFLKEYVKKYIVMCYYMADDEAIERHMEEVQAVHEETWRPLRDWWRKPKAFAITVPRMQMRTLLFALFLATLLAVARANPMPSPTSAAPCPTPTDFPGKFPPQIIVPGCYQHHEPDTGARLHPPPPAPSQSSSNATATHHVQ
ncbi:hypothetical protein PGQ11_012495 [Apiospora arundinis]|uniref:Uncharacterized protein n=1 Tax=Apiospora arundinis TaxID=335852 RepID=A0ABR2I2I5_9PEZI